MQEDGKSKEEEEACRWVPWVAFDGVLGPWADALHGFLDGDRHLWVAGSQRIELQQDPEKLSCIPFLPCFRKEMRFIFECAELSAASPALVTRCAVVCMP